METEIAEKFRNLFSNFKDALREPNYTNVGRLSNELTRVSLFLDVPEFIFVGEFLEWLFQNLRGIELDKENKSLLDNEILSLINEIENNTPPFEEAFKLNLLDKLVKLRSDATKIQFKYIATKRRPRPSLEDFLA
ncbi:Uncharacterised protein [uncultured archaeon]|nr:Uncharacterised protein [uncultured archaeon]